MERTKKKAKGKRVSKVIADAGYDSHEFFRYLGKEGIKAGVLVRKGSKVRGNAVVRAMRRGK